MADVYGLSHSDGPVADSSTAGPAVRTQKRQSRRLSKPRTNSSTANIRPKISLGPLDSLTRSAANSVADLLSPDLEKRASRNALNDYSSSAVQDESSPCQEAEDATSAEPQTEISSTKPGRIQRTGTKIVRHLNGSRQNITKSASISALNQYEEPAEDYQWLKDQAQRDRQAMHDHIPAAASDDRRDGPAPLRRKSLLTPGLATRGSDILRKPGDIAHKRSRSDLKVQARYYNPTLSPNSPLTHLASLDVPGRNVSESTRAATPQELDYGRIGGALRIANGGAYSPSLIHVAQTSEPPLMPAYRHSLQLTNWHPSSAVPQFPDDAEIDGSVHIVDTAVYDPYAEDAGNPWADEPEIAHDISAAFSHASRQLQKPIPSGQIESPIGSPSKIAEPETAEKPSFDYFSYPPAEAQQADESRRDSLPSSPEKETPSTDGRSSMMQLGPGASRRAEMVFEEEPPIMQGPRLGPPTPSFRPSTGEATLRDSRLEMARILDNMMAASRYTPVPHEEEWGQWPVSATSDRPSLSWGSSTGSSSNTSLTSMSHGKSAAAGGASPANSISHDGGISEASRDSPYLMPNDVMLEQQRQQNQRQHRAITKASPHPQPRQGESPIKQQQQHNQQFPTPPTPSSQNEARSPATYLTEVTMLEEPASPMSADRDMSPGAKQAKPAARKLQKRPPRPRSMPPVPVDRIVVSGHGAGDRGSPIPEVPEDMRARVAERWNSRPMEEREPTVPNVDPDYFSRQSQHSRNNSAPQMSPNAPPVPERSAARPKANRASAWGPAGSVVATPDEHRAPPQHLEQPAARSLASPGASSSVYSQSQYQQHPSSRPPTSHALPGTATDDEDMPIDWSKARAAWAARRNDAGQGLRMQMERAREQIEERGSLFPDKRASWAPQSFHQTAMTRSRTTAIHGAGSSRNEPLDKRRSLHLNMPYHGATSPLSQPSAAPSPLKQATNIDSEVHSPGADSYVSSGRHSKNHRSGDMNASYFPSTASMASAGTEFEGDVDTDGERYYDAEATRSKGPIKAQPGVSAGRYEGGLQFGFERGKGIGGSAGTRSVGGQQASRKTGAGNLAEGFGVDLSDVPIFVTRS